MEKLSFGLLNGIECQFVTKDQVLIDGIVKKTGMPVDKVQAMLRYNMFTFRQFSLLSGLTVSNITNKAKPSIINGVYDTELDYCFPFQAGEHKGFKFIVRNEKAEKFLKV
jgi:hypothetical protein